MEEPTALLPPVDTRSLDEILRERGTLPPPEAMLLMSAVALALVKVIERKGASAPLVLEHIRVSGLEQQLPAVILIEGEGTVDLSSGADVFSLGVVAFTALVGRPPRLDETLADALPQAPAAIDRLVGRLLARNAAERPTPAQAQRQFHELWQSLGEPSVRPASVLSAPPQIKRGPPIGELRTDAKAWALDVESTQGGGASAKGSTDENPFSDDEATATVQGPLSSDRDTDERTALDRGEPDLSATYRRAGFRTGDRAPLAPPIPAAGRATASESTTGSAPALGGDEPFEATKGDLMGRTLDPDAAAPKPRAPRPVRKQAKPLEELIALAQRQPPWIWGALGVGLAFLVLLLIALTR